MRTQYQLPVDLVTTPFMRLRYEKGIRPLNNQPYALEFFFLISVQACVSVHIRQGCVVLGITQHLGRKALRLLDLDVSDLSLVVGHWNQVRIDESCVGS